VRARKIRNRTAPTRKKENEKEDRRRVFFRRANRMARGDFFAAFSRREPGREESRPPINPIAARRSNASDPE